MERRPFSIPRMLKKHLLPFTVISSFRGHQEHVSIGFLVWTLGVFKIQGIDVEFTKYVSHKKKKTLNVIFYVIFMPWFIVVANLLHEMYHHLWRKTLEKVCYPTKMICFSSFVWAHCLFAMLLFAFVLSRRIYSYKYRLNVICGFSLWRSYGNFKKWVFPSWNSQNFGAVTIKVTMRVWLLFSIAFLTPCLKTPTFEITFNFLEGLGFPILAKFWFSL